MVKVAITGFIIGVALGLAVCTTVQRYEVVNSKIGTVRVNKYTGKSWCLDVRYKYVGGYCVGKEYRWVPVIVKHPHGVTVKYLGPIKR